MPFDEEEREEYSLRRTLPRGHGSNFDLHWKRSAKSPLSFSCNKTLSQRTIGKKTHQRFNLLLFPYKWTHFDHQSSKGEAEFDQDSIMRTPFRSGFCFLILVLVCISLPGHSVSADNRRPKNVQVALRAKWSGTPVLLEAGYAFLLTLLIAVSYFV